MGMKYDVPATRFELIPNFMKQGGFYSFVEVGCKEGRLTSAVLKNVPRSRVVAIDPWKAMPDHAGREGGETYEEWDFEKIERQFWDSVAGHAGRLEMRRQTSLEAAAHYQELKDKGQLPKEDRRGFDVVFIDAAHDQENVEADIRAWWPLVRNGGFLMGHDYQHKFPGTMRAVAKYFPLMRVGVMPDSIWMVMKAEDIGP